MRIQPVLSADEPELAVFRERAEAHLYHWNEPEPGLFVAETPMVIDRALDAGYEPQSVLGEPKILQKELPAMEERLGDVPVYSASDEMLRLITGYRLIRVMLCVMRRRPIPPADEICQEAKRLVVLENVMNPTNIGAIFRSAAALGMDAVLLTRGCSDPLYRRAARVSVGNVFLIPWTFFPGNMEAADRITFLRRFGFRTAAMALREDALLLGTDPFAAGERLAVFMGTEGDGLCRETIEGCDAVLRIPMAGGVDSLNVAAASAIAFWELQRAERRI